MKSSLAFRSDGTFTIVQFTDIHWQDGGPKDQQSRQLMASVLDSEKPDLVVYTGDIIYTGRTSLGEPVCEFPGRAFLEAVESAEARGIPWSFVFGNHDTELGITRGELMDVALSQDHCTVPAEAEERYGVGNYRLQIAATDGTPAAVLYFFDSGNLSRVPGVKGYDWIHPDQIGWYISQSAEVNRSLTAAKLPALAFFHIPLPEYKEVWAGGNCRGHQFEEICCAQVNGGLFAALLETGDVMGTFAGHDHVNDYWGELHGIRLCYGRATGYNTYGREGFQRGARVIRLWQGVRDFETWLRLADGSRVIQAATQ
ncbi:metallophosphoesterase family protein [Paenibacillus filicis]|uniref:Metallophosphoesterase family protein n=1 Tax=Paenibacillus gyeongsangnamensis TaxID=3388067 RepID=A0ABT4QJ14_9BACL|nr:metallophosphoesterase family protein [Paenibacillus filicis]MCZ8516867.1 metallophosphoesterase family protein [Paenibacillus filicis]